MQAFHLRSLTVGYDDKIAIAGIRCVIEKNRTTALIGPGGSGKTTLLRLLAMPEHGPPVAMWYRGIVWRQKATLAVLPQHSSSASSSLGELLWQRVGKGLDLHRFIDTLWSEVSLAAAALIRNSLAVPRPCLPRSLRRLVDITVALSCPGDIVLLDEPEAGTDDLHCEWIRTKLAALRGTRTIVMVTHHLPLVRAASDQSIFLLDGHIVETGATTAMFQNPQHPRTRDLITMGG